MENLVEELEFFRNKRIFITGHTGFKGTWLCKMLILAGAKVTGYSLPSPTTEGEKVFRLSGVGEAIHSIIGDIRDQERLQRFFNAAAPEIVFHLAAQPLVLASYEDPVGTYATNVMGTVNILECLRHSSSVKSFLNVTTDKVYENKEWSWGYRENDPLDGYDPYSNSKSCSELVTHSYKKSFLAKQGIAVSTARAGNVIGGGDFAENRIIPDAIRAAYSKKPISIRNPHSTRPYQHVLEPLAAYLMIARAQYNEACYADYYNVGPDDCDCVTTGELAELFCQAWGEGQAWRSVSKENPHEANFLKLDCSKLKQVFGWRPKWHIDQAVRKTVEWAKLYQSGGDISGCMERQIREFLQEAEAWQQKPQMK